jgi:hypothetical protein
MCSWLKFKPDPVSTAIQIPFFDLDGSPLTLRDGRPFIRFRRDVPGDTKGKYLQPKGSGVKAYIPQVGDLNWVDIAHDSEVALVLVEGEMKSVAGAKSGVPTLAITGVDCFKDKTGNLAEPLNKFNWTNRKLFICFDADPESDADNPYKKGVADGAHRCASHFYTLGADVRLLYIARTKIFKPGSKMGLDDYLLAGGTFEELMATAVRAETDSHLAYFMRNYAIYTGKGAHVLRLSDGVGFRKTEFVEVLEAHRVRLGGPNGRTPIKVAREFVDHPSRPIVERIVFDPSADGGYDPVARVWNGWRGWGVEAVENKAWEEVFKKLVSGLFKEWDWYFTNWLAHMIQKPAEKTTISVIICTPLEGIGKSLLGEVIRGVVGPRSSFTTDLAQLVNHFNSRVEYKVFGQSDEAEGLFMKYENKLKDLVSSDKVVIERKGYDAYEVDNYLRLYLTSNSLRPIRMGPHNRRFFVHMPDLTEEVAKKYWTPWLNEVASKLKGEDGLRAVRWYLEHVDLSDWNPTQPVPVTDAMRLMVEGSATKGSAEVDCLLESLREDGWWAIDPTLRSRNTKVWTDLIGAVKIAGGQRVAHTVKIKGKTAKVVLLNMGQRWPEKPKAEDNNVYLDNAGVGITGEQIASALARANAAYGEAMNTVGSDKF